MEALIFVYFKEVKMAEAHKHLIIRAETLHTPNNVVHAKQWLIQLVRKIDMKLLSVVLPNPNAGYCDVEGNRGLTAIALIETSHIILHAWDEEKPGLVQLDVYSCAPFKIKDVIDHMQIWSPTKIEYKFLDRETGLIEIPS